MHDFPRCGVPCALHVLLALALVVLLPGGAHASDTQWWILDSPSDYAKSEARGVVVRPDGSLEPGPRAVSTPLDSLAVVWSAVVLKDRSVALAGDHGRILRWSPAGGVRPWARLAAGQVLFDRALHVFLPATILLVRGVPPRLVGGGVGWNEPEFANLGVAERFSRRGAYLDETIRLWRHLWSGSSEPFEGEFHRLHDFVFGPLPAQGAQVPLLVGGRSGAALRRAGSLGDGYHSSSTGPAAYALRLPQVRAAAEASGRDMPHLSARVNVRFGPTGRSEYLLSGDSAAMLEEVRAFAAIGVEHLALGFEPREPDAFVAAVECFDREVVKAAHA